MFEIREKDLLGRTGTITTRHGKVETPAFFPVVNPVRQDVGLETVARYAGQVITNAYLVRRSYGDLAKELGLHRILGWEGPIMTDSGAYQLLQYGQVHVDPDEVLMYQVDIGSDIGVILDIPSSVEESYESVSLGVEETLRRARRAIEMLRDRKGMLLVGPVQGADRLGLLAHSARAMARLDFDMYAIGSPTTLLERYDFYTIAKIIVTAKRALPPGKPVHLFGAGHPLVIPLAVALGIDTFDSASYVLYARDDRIMTPTGTIRLEDVKTEHIPTHGRLGEYRTRDLMEMPREERTRIIAEHNLEVLVREIEIVRQRIHEGTLWEYLEQKARAHPSLYAALRVFGRYRKFVAASSPETRPETFGRIYFGDTAHLRPEPYMHFERVRPQEKPILILLHVGEKPYTRTWLYRWVVERLEEAGVRDRVHIAFLDGIFGPVPEEVAEVYPLSQNTSMGSSREALDRVLAFLGRYDAAISNVPIRGAMYEPSIDKLVEKAIRLGTSASI